MGRWHSGPVMNFRGRVFLAPLTKGGNLPFRRLCLAHGAEVTMGEMAYAYQVKKRSKSELALLRKHADETCFGAQIAASKPADAILAGNAAVERGASWVDLNCGCPIHDIVRRTTFNRIRRLPASSSRLVGLVRWMLLSQFPANLKHVGSPPSRLGVNKPREEVHHHDAAICFD